MHGMCPPVVEDGQMGVHDDDRPSTQMYGNTFEYTVPDGSHRMQLTRPVWPVNTHSTQSPCTSVVAQLACFE